ncbi:OpgC domain-containing protein [Rhodococcus sp. IEGM 1381]|uniref:OpgC domain-containing protein n=1 Tax=Rhodococcus sp. IEGM 1381 TaxID=3047085 RepID=UPI0024B83155|nr:OpgC domain-containing protein [Rhodococcus sp. IEGM 1381]MDI9894219.1 OpgC domain-containing protein [Rhodococcus sp. IEGM 1381]
MRDNLEMTLESATVRRPGRDQAIDVVRALCIVSMTFDHVARGSIGWHITHAPVWYTGAMGFVLPSGLVVGMVYRGIVDRNGLRFGQLKVLRRARLVYISHVFLCALAFFMVVLFPSRAAASASIDDTGVWGAIWRTLTLNINPPNASILSLYAILLLLSVGAIWLLKRGQWGVLVALSLLLYFLAQVSRDTFTFTRRAGGDGSINWGTWQTLFFLALLAGWYWQSSKIQDFLRSRRTLLLSAAISLVLILSGQAFRLGMLDNSPLYGIVFNIFGRPNLGPGSIAMAFLFTFVTYRLCGSLCNKYPGPLGLTATIGRRSLDCYLILSILVIIEPIQPEGALMAIYPIPVLAIMLTWCLIRDRRGLAKRRQKLEA